MPTTTTDEHQPIMVDVCESDFSNSEISFTLKVFLPPDSVARFIGDQARLRTFRRVLLRLLTPAVVAFFKGPSEAE